LEEEEEEEEEEEIDRAVRGIVLKESTEF